jgi:hypothetical protein
MSIGEDRRKKALGGLGCIDMPHIAGVWPRTCKNALSHTGIYRRMVLTSALPRLESRPTGFSGDYFWTSLEFFW